jgi:hypothetical protein
VNETPELAPTSTLRAIVARVEEHAILLAVLLTLFAGLATMTPTIVGVFFDDAVYLLVAKALAAGDGFVYPQLPGTPPAIHYPPLYPLLLSLVWRISPEFPANVVLFKLVNPLLISCAAAGAVVAAQRIFNVRPIIALGIVLAGTISVPVHVLTTVVLSEPLFLALLFPALLAAEAARREQGLGWAITAAALAGALVLTRTIGGVVVIATVMVFVFERRWRLTALYIAAVALLLAPWQMFVWKHSPGFTPELRGSYGPYLEWLVDGYKEGGWPLLRDVATKNIADTWSFVGAFVSPLMRGPVRGALTIIAGIFALWGLLRGLVDPDRRLTVIALGGYLTLVAIWPYQVDRFVWGVWPLLLMVAYAGARDLHSRLANNASPLARQVVMALALVLVAGHTFYNARGFSRGWASSASRGMADRLLPIIQYVNSDPRLRGKTISTEASPLVALYSGNTVVPAEVLVVQDHIAPKSRAERAEVIGAIDRRFRPDAYVLMVNGPFLPALLQASFDPGRNFREISPAGLRVRAFHVLR